VTFYTQESEKARLDNKEKEDAKFTTANKDGKEFFKYIARKLNILNFLPMWIFLEIFWGKCFIKAGRKAKEGFDANFCDFVWQFPIFHPIK
jgi:hypothetical protein